MKDFRYILRYYIDPGYDEDARITELINFCNDSCIKEVMLFFNPEEVNNGHITPGELADFIPMAKKIKAALKENGIALSLNPWATTLHSPRGRKLKPGQDFRLMVGETGHDNGVTVCPLCKNWLKYICDLWAYAVKELEPDAIWIEDDWRLHNHGRILGWGGCFCDEHLRLFSERAGVEVTREEVIVYDNGLDEIGKPIGTGTIYKNELLELKKIKKSRFDFQSAFDKICSPGATPFEESIINSKSGSTSSIVS